MKKLTVLMIALVFLFVFFLLIIGINKHNKNAEASEKNFFHIFGRVAYIEKYYIPGHTMPTISVFNETEKKHYFFYNSKLALGVEIKEGDVVQVIYDKSQNDHFVFFGFRDSHDCVHGFSDVTRYRLMTVIKLD